jgi:hypothetical protein
LAFEAPKPSLDFLAGADVGVEVDPSLFALASLFARLAAAAAEVVVLGAEAEVALLVVVAGDGVRPMMGGEVTLGVEGLEVFGVVGFDHDSKKSSSPCGVLEFELAPVSTPSTTIP